MTFDLGECLAILQQLSSLMYGTGLLLVVGYLLFARPNKP